MASSAVRTPDATPHTLKHIGIKGMERICLWFFEENPGSFRLASARAWAIKNSGHVHVNSIKQHITYKPDYNHHHQQHLREVFLPPKRAAGRRSSFGMQSSGRNSWTFGCQPLQPLTFQQPNMLLIRPVTFFGCKTICNHKLWPTVNIQRWRPGQGPLGVRSTTAVDCRTYFACSAGYENFHLNN